MRVLQRVGSETSNINGVYERDVMLPTAMFPSDDSGIASIGQSGRTGAVSREFVRLADAVDAKPPSKPAFW